MARARARRVVNAGLKNKGRTARQGRANDKDYWHSCLNHERE